MTWPRKRLESAVPLVSISYYPSWRYAASSKILHGLTLYSLNKTIFGYKFGLFYAVLSFPQSGWRIATSVRFFCVVVSMFCGSTGSKEKSGSRLSWRRTWQSLVSVLQRNTQILENLNNSE
jgi:hypothetical protein